MTNLKELILDSPQATENRDPEYTRSHTQARDITDNFRLLDKTRGIVTLGYQQLSGQKIDKEAVYKMLFPDPYTLNGRARTIATISQNPDGTEEISGTVRLVVGANGIEEGLEPIDAMGLVNVPTWPHREMGLKDSEIGEFGRFAIPPDYRTEEMRTARVPALITRQLYEKTVEIAKRRGLKTLYAIMPSSVVQLSRAAGVNFTPVKDVSFKRTPQNQQLFQTFDRYWLNPKSSPALYQFLF